MNKNENENQKVSKKNINALLELKPTRAKDIGVESRWLRRFKEKGLSYITSKNSANLDILAAHFSLKSKNDFFCKDLNCKLPHLQPILLEAESLLQSDHRLTMSRLHVLLETGRFNFLVEMIKHLYECNSEFIELGESLKEETAWSESLVGEVYERSRQRQVKNRSLSDFVKKKSPRR